MTFRLATEFLKSLSKEPLESLKRSIEPLESLKRSIQVLDWILVADSMHRRYLSSPNEDPSQLHTVRERGLLVGYGDGFLYLRGAIWWMCYVGPQGRVRATTGVRDRHTAELILRSKANAYADGQATFAKASTQLVAEYKIHGRRNLSELKRCLKGHILPAMGELDLARIGTATVERYTLARLTEGAAPATVNRELTIIRGTYALAQRRHPEMALAQWRVPSLPERNVRRGFLIYPEYRKLLALLPAHVKPVVICAYYWGCRRGELLGDCRAERRREPLRWDQVDLHGGVVQILHSKNDQPRELPIYSTELKSVFQRPGRLRSPYVFLRKGRPFWTFRKAWSMASLEIGKPDLKFHDLRRSAIRNMVRAGVPAAVAMMITGHRTRSIFERYNIVDQSEFEIVGDKMNEYLTENAHGEHGEHGEGAG